MTRLTMLAVAVLLALTACGDDATPKATQPTAEPIRSNATIGIVSPKQGQAVEATSIPVKIKLEGGTLAEKASNNPADDKPDVGHMHVILDGKTISVLQGLEFDLVSVLAEAKEPQISKGRHILIAEFATVSHRFFAPRVTATATFTIV